MYQPFFLLLAYTPRPEPEPRTALAGLGPGLGLEKSQAWALESQAKATASRPSRAVTSLDVELNTVDWSDGGEYIQGKHQGDTRVSLSFPPWC